MNTFAPKFANKLAITVLVGASMLMPVVAAGLSHNAPQNSLSTDTVNQVTTAFAHAPL